MADKIFRQLKSGKRQFSLIEYPDLITAGKLWKHPEIIDAQVDNFKKYCDEAIENKQVKVDYILYKPYGRYFVKDTKKTSSCPMWCKLRSTLFSATEYDIDIVGCHQSIMYDLLAPNADKYKLDALKRYVDDRDAIIDEFDISKEAIDKYNKKNNCYATKKDVVKSLFTFSYGGIVDTWVREWNFEEEDYELPDFVDVFIEELQWNLHIMCGADERFKDIVKWKTEELKAEYKKFHPDPPADKRQRKKGVEYFDPDKFKINKGKILSVILQDFERQILEGAMEWTLKTMKLTITSYNFDGFQILQKDVPDDYIEQLNKYIQELKTPYYKIDGPSFIGVPNVEWNNIKFIKKEFKEPLTSL